MTTFKTLLLVEDDVDDQLLFSDAIDAIDLDIKLSIANNGIEAFLRLQDDNLLPDVIFLDINMPMMSGFEFLSEIKRIDRLAHIPIVIFTTSNSPEQIKHSQQLGASAFLTKPANFDRLCDKLRNILASDLIMLQKARFEII